MKASLRALLSGVIDYAGLFPPAQLPLEQALKNYAEYRAGPDAWMLGRFVCPAAKLAELTEFPPLSVVGRGGNSVGQGGTTIQEFLAGQRQDQQDMLAIISRRPGAVIDGYEVRLGGELIQARFNIDRRKISPHEIAEWSKFEARLKRAKSRLQFEHEKELLEAIAGVKAPGTTFFEIDRSYELGFTNRLIALLAEQSGRGFGLKIRCGGAIASAVPSVAALNLALTFCRLAGVPIKFTAGLHHPLRWFDKALGVKAHGFLNVFLAGVLSHARQLDERALKQILEEREIGSFHFDENGLGWKDICATTDEVIAARRHLVTSFGSCSFDEPREDLRALGLMD